MVAAVARGARRFRERPCLPGLFRPGGKGKIWIASLDRTVLYYHGQKWQSFSFSDPVADLTESPKYGVLFNVMGKGLYAYDGTQMQLVNPTPFAPRRNSFGGYSARFPQPFEPRSCGPGRSTTCRRRGGGTPSGAHASSACRWGSLAARRLVGAGDELPRNFSGDHPRLPRWLLEQRRRGLAGLSAFGQRLVSVPGTRARWPAKATVRAGVLVKTASTISG